VKRGASVVVFSSCCSLVLTTTAAAQSIDRAVDVVIAGDDSQAAQMQGVAEELVQRLGVVTRIARAQHVEARDVIVPRPAAPAAVARAWIDLTQPERATLYLVDEQWERILIRHVPETRGKEELTREEVGHILETAVDALLHGSRIGITREEARSSIAPSPPPPPPPARPATVHFEGGVYYAAQVFSTDAALTHGPLVSLLAARDTGPHTGPVRPGLMLTAQVRFPVEVDQNPVGVRIDSGAFRVLAVADRALGEKISLRLGLGGGVDLLHYAPRIESSAASAAPDSTFLEPILQATGAMRVHLLREAVLSAGLALDFAPTGSRYIAVVGQETRVVLSELAVRPGVVVGVTTP